MNGTVKKPSGNGHSAFPIHDLQFTIYWVTIYDLLAQAEVAELADAHV